MSWPLTSFFGSGQPSGWDAAGSNSWGWMNLRYWEDGSHLEGFLFDSDRSFLLVLAGMIPEMCRWLKFVALHKLETSEHNYCAK